LKLPELRISDLVAKIPVIQGGMAVRISTGSLAGAVAATGGIGIIGASGMSFEELAHEIKIAREKAMGGIVGINIMFAAREFLGIVSTAIKEKIDLIITGAGFSKDVFKIGKEHGVPIVSIVSTVRLAKTAEKCGAAAIVVEGKEAGGHLGTDRPLFDILPEIVEAVKIPVIAAGGLINGALIAKALKIGAKGVQLATRFVLAEECNASLPYKKRYQTASEDDVVLIDSPVGMPGRALRTKFVDQIIKGTAPKPVGCDFCLKHCSLKYCIVQALIRSQKGDIENGIVFSGEKVWQLKDRTIKPAKKIMEEIIAEVEEVP